MSIIDHTLNKYEISLKKGNVWEAFGISDFCREDLEFKITISTTQNWYKNRRFINKVRVIVLFITLLLTLLICEIIYGMTFDEILSVKIVLVILQ